MGGIGVSWNVIDLPGIGGESLFWLASFFVEAPAGSSGGTFASGCFVKVGVIEGIGVRVALSGRLSVACPIAAGSVDICWSRIGK